MEINKKFDWAKIGAIIVVAASLVTIVVFFSSYQERIAKLEEFKENVVDKLEKQIYELEKKVQEQNCRIAWLEGFIDSFSKGRFLYQAKNKNEEKE